MVSIVQWFCKKHGIPLKKSTPIQDDLGHWHNGLYCRECGEEIVERIETFEDGDVE